MIEQFNLFFNKSTQSSTYKPTFVKCLLDIGDCKDGEGKEWVEDNGEYYIVDLNFIIARFLRFYHPLKFQWKLKQEATEKTIAIYGILDRYKELVGIKSPPSLKKFCSEKFSGIREETIKNSAIQQMVMPLLLKDCNIYEHDRKKITIKKEIVDYMKNNRNVLVSALNNMISIYLEKCNKKIPDISTKLLDEYARKPLSGEEKRNIISIAESKCFYCNNKFEKFEADHFIPWNFIPQTEIYNMVPACEGCNGSKSDNLPDDEFLEKIIIRNKKLEKLPLEYSDDFMNTIFGNCRSEYHGIDKELWKP